MTLPQIHTELFDEGTFEQDGFKVAWRTESSGDTYLLITAPDGSVLKMGANDTGAWPEWEEK